MIPLGKAKLVENEHATGVTVKSWDLSPWGGPMVFLGPITQPLPPPGTTVDRDNLRLDTGTGDVWQLEAGDPPPKVGMPGAVGTAFKFGPLAAAAIIGLVFASLRSR